MTDEHDAHSDSDLEEVERLRSENEALRSRLHGRSGVRKWTAAVFVALTSLAVVTATLTVWVHQVVFDTDEFMSVVGPAIEDPAFYDGLSDAASTQALEALDIEERVTARLEQVDAFLSETLIDVLDLGEPALAILDRVDRPSLSALAPSIAEGLEGRVVERIDGFFHSERFQDRFPQIVEEAHAAAIALIEDDLAAYPNVYVAEGDVRLNLIPLIVESLQPVIDELREFFPDVTLPAVVADGVAEARQQLGDAVDAQLPEDFGQLTIMSEDSLEELQAAGAIADRMVWIIVIVTMLLFVVTIIVSPSRRRTLIQLAIGVVAGLVVAMVIVRRAEGALTEAISNPNGEEVVRTMFTELAASLRGITVAVAVIAIILGVIAYFAGRPPWFESAVASTRARASGDMSTEPTEFDGWVGGHADLLRLLGIAVAVIAIFVTGWSLLTALIVALLLGLWLWVVGTARQRVEMASAVQQELAEAGAGTDA